MDDELARVCERRSTVRVRQTLPSNDISRLTYYSSSELLSSSEGSRLFFASRSACSFLRSRSCRSRRSASFWSCFALDFSSCAFRSPSTSHSLPAGFEKDVVPLPSFFKTYEFSLIVPFSLILWNFTAPGRRSLNLLMVEKPMMVSNGRPSTT